MVASDAAQIRHGHGMAVCQWDMVEQFAQGIDVYADFASFVYGYPVNRKDHQPTSLAKQDTQLGYQSDQ